MGQHRSVYVDLPVRTQAQGAPTDATHGVSTTELALPLSGPAVWSRRYVVRVHVVGAGSGKLSLFGFDAGLGWGLPVDPNGNPGLVAGNLSMTAGVYWTVFEDMAAFDRVCLVQHDNSGGTPVITASIASLVEKVELH